jgi:hypothetical protein
VALPDDFHTSLAHFKAAVRVDVHAFIDNQDELPAQTSLYQYTNEAGLRGILQSGTIWMSDIFTMNDTSEVRHGCSQALQVLQRRAENGHPVIKMLAEGLSRFNRAAIPILANFYIGSFTTNGDDLGQWRAYGDDGYGFALGFDASMLMKCFEAQSGALMMTMPISYDDRALAVLHNEWVDEARKLLMRGIDARLSVEDFRELFSEVANTLSLGIYHSALFFKHESYRHEAEYRFMEIHHTDGLQREIRSRQRADGTNVSYVTYDWRSVAPKALTSITVGPAGNQEQLAELVADYLREFDLGDVRVLRSQIPYRAPR